MERFEISDNLETIYNGGTYCVCVWGHIMGAHNGGCYSFDRNIAERF